MCLTGNQKVSKWIAIHLQQIDGLQIRHFVPHPAIKWAGYNNAYHTRPSKITQKLLESDGKVTGKCLELARNRTRDWRSKFR